MFQELGEKFSRIFEQLRRETTLKESHIESAMREIRRALLEADVNYKVAKEFVSRVSERAMGQKVMASLTPDQQIIKIVHEELAAILGGKSVPLRLSGNPASVMIAGLQGSGKTSFAAKLAMHIRSMGRSPLLVAADIHRLAAIEQLSTLGKQIQVPVFSQGTDVPAPDIARNALKEARRLACDTVIVDTAGRLHIDEQMMEELVAMKKALDPEATLLVLDGMTGEEAVRVAEEFARRVDFTGVVLTKLDGDARGGAALSVASVTGKPILFACVGEKPADLEIFHPDRMAGRILGMGDVLSLIEKVEQTMDVSEAKQMEKKLRRETITLEDFLAELQRLRKIGPLERVIGMIPGVKVKSAIGDSSERELRRIEAIVRSMTPEERRAPHIIDGSRRKRIAMGSGTSVQEVNRLLARFEEMKKMMKRLSKHAGSFPFEPPVG